MAVWQNAGNAAQKKAILEHFLPTTHDEYVDAAIAFAEDEDDAIRSLAFVRLRSLDIADLIKRATAAATRRTVRTLARYCVANPHPGLIARLLNSKKLPWSLVEEFWLTPQEDLWRALVANRNFVLFSHPQNATIATFLDSFNKAIAAVYREQVQWVTEKELAAFVRPSEQEEVPSVAPVAAPGGPEGETVDFTDRVVIQGIDTFHGGVEVEGVSLEELVQPGQEMNVSGALFDTGEGVVAADDEVVDLDSVELDVPDFLLAENPFEGMTPEDIALHRQKIQDILKSLSMGERVKLATVGNMEVRKMLIKDPRRIVAMAVLGNGGITPGEIAGLAINPATFQDVVEHIANNRNLSKSYMVKFALVMNPKTPIKVAQKFLEIVRRADLKKVSENKGITPIIRNMAKKRMQ